GGDEKETFVTASGFGMGMCFNPVDRRLYWSDYQQIESVDDAGGDRITLVADISPYQITLDAANGHVYWLDDNGASGPNRIFRVNLDGTGKAVFVEDPDPGYSPSMDFPYEYPESSNTPPTASEVSVSGMLEVDEILTGNYTYSDEDDDAQDGTTFKWYRSDDADGTNKVVIAGATAETYTLQAADADKY